MRFYTKQHQFYCGIDLHADAMYVCILDSTGEIVVHKNIPAKPKSFLRLIKTNRRFPDRQPASFSFTEKKTQAKETAPMSPPAISRSLPLRELSVRSQNLTCGLRTFLAGFTETSLRSSGDKGGDSRL